MQFLSRNNRGLHAYEIHTKEIDTLLNPSICVIIVKITYYRIKIITNINTRDLVLFKFSQLTDFI